MLKIIALYLTKLVFSHMVAYILYENLKQIYVFFVQKQHIGRLITN